jgi:hypothetical protein
MKNKIWKNRNRREEKRREEKKTKLSLYRQEANQ